jgi:hypothetical protein
MAGVTGGQPFVAMDDGYASSRASGELPRLVSARSFASARDTVLFTVPSETPRTAAVSASVRSS